MCPNPASTLPEASRAPYAGQDVGEKWNWGMILALVATGLLWAVVAGIVTVLA